MHDCLTVASLSTKWFKHIHQNEILILFCVLFCQIGFCVLPKWFCSVFFMIFLSCQNSAILTFSTVTVYPSEIDKRQLWLIVYFKKTQIGNKLLVLLAEITHFCNVSYLFRLLSSFRLGLWEGSFYRVAFYDRKLNNHHNNVIQYDPLKMMGMKWMWMTTYFLHYNYQIRPVTKGPPILRLILVSRKWTKLEHHHNFPLFSS
jgi:hypothetical protein